MKSEGDPVTQVDHTVQQEIIHRLTKAMPLANIVGEEKFDEDMILPHLSG